MAAIVDFGLPPMRLTTGPLSHGIERSLVDRRERSRSPCVAAEAAILKGDLDLTRRLLIQADADDPTCTHPGDRPQWLERQKDRFDEVSSNPRPKGPKLDFLDAPTLRGLSSELSSRLPLHANILAVSKGELDRALEERSETALLAKYQHRGLVGRHPLRAGLVQHALIAAQLAGPQVVARLATLTTRKLFGHGDRNPLSLVISDFNHESTARYCHAYVIWPMYRRMPFRSVYSLADRLKYKFVRTLRRRAGYGRARAASKGGAMLAEWLLERRHSALSLDKTLIEARPTEALSRPRHFVVGHTYSRHFDTWVPINLETPLRPERGLVNRVVEAVAVDANNTYHPPRARACQSACFGARPRFVFVTL